MTVPSIRLATVEDIPDFHRIDAATDAQFIDAGHPELAGNGSYIPIEIAHRAIAESRILVAELDGVVGWVIVMRFGDELAIGQIAVHPEFQQRGVGSRLARSVVSRASAAGERSLALSTQSDLAWNRPWYETLGFVTVPVTEWTAGMHTEAADQVNLDWAETRIFMRLVLPAPDVTE